MLGAGLMKVQVGWQGFVLQGQDDFDQSGDASGGFQGGGVADVGFDGTDVQRLLGSMAAAKNGSQCADFDGVAEGGAGAVGFDVADLVGLQSRPVQGFSDNSLLGGAIGNGQAAAADHPG